MLDGLSYLSTESAVWRINITLQLLNIIEFRIEIV